MPKPKSKPPRRARPQSLVDDTRRVELQALRKATRQQKDIGRMTRSLQVLITRNDRTLREFADWIRERNGDIVAIEEAQRNFDAEVGRV